MSTTFRDATMSKAEREVRAILNRPDTDTDMFSAATVRTLLHDLDIMREVASDDRDKWSFETLLMVGRALLAYIYPADIFTGESGDSGPLYVVALRNAIERIDAMDLVTHNVTDVVQLMAHEIGKRVAEIDWPTSDDIESVVQERATEVLTKWVSHLASERDEPRATARSKEDGS